MFLKAAIRNTDEQKLPSIQDFLVLRKTSEGEINEDYIFFCEKFLKCVVGMTTFNEGWKMKSSICSMATPSDEAFALLILENNEERWKYIFEVDSSSKNSEGSKSDRVPPAKYTCSGRSKSTEGFTRRNSGWSLAGIERFNTLLEMVKEDRKQNGDWFDDMMLERRQNSEDARKKVVPKSPSLVRAGNDLFDDDDFNEDFHIVDDVSDDSDDEDDNEDQADVDDS